MAVTLNTTTTANITTTVKELDFVTRFNRNWQALSDIMGIMRPIKKTAGTKLVASKATIELQSGTVAEGDEVPLSQATVTPVAYKDIKLNKYRKRVTAELVEKFGPEVAVQKTDDALLDEITGGILTDFFTFAQTGTLTGKEKTFQMAVSMAIGKVKDKFKKLRLSYDNIVVFVNTLDLARYLGSTPVTIQTSNGVEYIKDFLGAKTVIVTSEIPEKKVLAIPASNIVLYYMDPREDLTALGLDYTVGNEPTKLIGVHKEAVYGRVAGDTHALSGMVLFAEYIDGIAVMTIDESAGAKV